MSRITLCRSWITGLCPPSRERTARDSSLSYKSSHAYECPQVGCHPVNHPFPDIVYVFLDRDGVINRKAPEGEYVARWRDVQLLPGAESAIAALNRSGRHVIVVSNQRGIALGHYTRADVEALHARLQEHLAGHQAHIDAFYYCPHDTGQCDCRKPGTGLFRQAFRDFPLASTANSIVIGDSLSDIEAARALGMPSIFIPGEPSTQKEGAETAARLADRTSVSLLEAVEQHLLDSTRADSISAG
jgi:D-glycero-D-manno-heptose 1,7-bisphosphate phosphatase